MTQTLSIGLLQKAAPFIQQNPAVYDLVIGLNRASNGADIQECLDKYDSETGDFEFQYED